LGRVFHGDFGADGFEVSYERLHVGCVIVTGGDRKNRLVAAGCKGFLPGTPHVSRLREGREQATIPAEQNAIADAARRPDPKRPVPKGSACYMLTNRGRVTHICWK
jgi:deoxycytidylate deaminase